MRANEFVTEDEDIVSRRFLYGKGTRPLAILEINKHTMERMDRPGHRALRDIEIERPLGKISRNLGLIFHAISPPQVCSVYDQQTHIAFLLQIFSPVRHGGPPRLRVTTVTPGRMWGREFREEIDLR